MTVKATLNDLDTVCEIYDTARNFMRQNGNFSQWQNGYPQKRLLKTHIENGEMFLILRDNTPCGCFTFKIGEDATYGQIDGKWLSNAPYGAVHLVASNGKSGGILKEAVGFAKSKISHLRMDTHRDNVPMLSALKNNGFVRVGVIITHDGTLREAFEQM
ncbi:MAG: N-acetyltransferase [Oscillospiraceae bacterium]|nr:N-acetyltransferase [Candidatus Equicaccousia limihippi]